MQYLSDFVAEFGYRHSEIGQSAGALPWRSRPQSWAEVTSNARRRAWGVSVRTMR
jgi:hypothetical protein